MLTPEELTRFTITHETIEDMNFYDLIYGLKKNKDAPATPTGHEGTTTMTPEKLTETLAKHALWLKTKGKEGERADLSGADLYRADLSGANLEGAKLRCANLALVKLAGANLAKADLAKVDLYETIGNMKEIKSLQLDKYSIAYTADRLQIGCQNHSIEEWKGFDDDTIKDMAFDAMPWWQANKDFIFDVITRYPATPTGHEET